ncbi:hypothetical protein DAETH_41520 (plasmid) [Deinococcus aetherius]|uniref:Uncharacterized protein n=1 Tax=Deinococcus aetherius TaxID=200252 RepID=A0ABN6RQQ7_9DEIO|nr:hypothetical protein [Deinococcus aetherius]BDP44183.1 hypothetical protein DAETH_41520 [Deinococcus aetherius]
MNNPLDAPHAELLDTIAAWQRGETTRDAVVTPLTLLGGEQGEVVQQLVEELLRHASPRLTGEAGGQGTDQWRAELMACRAKTWGSPTSAGLLVGPTVLILTDGRRGVVLDDSGTQLLKSSVSASLLLLCQTIVLADNAVDAQEVGRLRQQRIESTSTSLSEIKPVQ